MDFNDLVTLIRVGKPTVSPSGIPETTEERYECFAKALSIGSKEFYQAQSSGMKPEMKFVLPDYLEYDGENLLEHDGIRYKVLRTYRAGTQLEITVYGGVHVERAKERC